MILAGIGDEAGEPLEAQVEALTELGWKQLEARTVLVEGFEKGNLHDIPDGAFDTTVRKLEQAGVGVYCFGSTIMNWAKRAGDPSATTEAEVKRAIPRMQRLGTRYVRIMSFKPGDEEFRIPRVVFQRVRDIVNRFQDAGLQPVHENCMNYGGMSWQHALELLDACPGLKWAFDTANPLSNQDRSKAKPWPRQGPWEFWEHVRDQVAHIHVKDGSWDEERKAVDYCWPGEGQARVVDILKDAVGRGYSGAISIEPHMTAVFHEEGGAKVDLQERRKNFVRYGRCLEELLHDLRG